MNNRENSVRFSYRISRWCAGCIFTLVTRGRVWGSHYVPATGGVILASNHQSFLDPLLVTLSLQRECAYLARDTLFTNPLFGRLIRFYNAFPIKRGTADLSAMKEAIRIINKNLVLTTFPEGTRSVDGRLAPCMPGVISIAKKTGAPIVPVVMEGAFESWPRTSPLPKPATIWVEYGPPLHVAKDADTRQQAEHLTAVMRTLHNRLRERMGRKPFQYD